jgi:hypothetical protein
VIFRRKKYKQRVTKVTQIPSGKLRVCELENGPVEIVDLPINSMVNFHSYLAVYRRVSGPVGMVVSFCLKSQVETMVVAKGSVVWQISLQRISGSGRWGIIVIPICSMYGIFTYICPNNHPVL